jgi:uncharacterized OsmC-like protein
MVAVWASRFLPPLSADLPQVEVAEGVVSTETLAGTFQLKVRSGEHTLFADEPASVGGLRTGLSPYELVSAGLAACTVMTMRLYANRKGFPLERASTTVQHEKVPDMMPPDRFTRTIVLDGPLSDDQRARILAIADRCPVDLSLIRGSDVQTELLSASRAADREAGLRPWRTRRRANGLSANRLPAIGRPRQSEQFSQAAASGAWRICCAEPGSHFDVSVTQAEKCLVDYARHYGMRKQWK